MSEIEFCDACQGSMPQGAARRHQGGRVLCGECWKLTRSLGSSKPKAEHVSSSRQVGLWLGIGIFFIPFVFSWFTLRKGHSLLSRLVSFAWLCVLIFAPQNETKKHSNTGASLPRIPWVTAANLYSAYDANEIAADQTYKGKRVMVEGIVENVGKDILDNMYVALGGSGLFGVQCFFDDRHATRLAALHKGMRVNIIGRCNGKFGNVILEECAFEIE